MDIEQMKKELAEPRAYKEAAEKQEPVPADKPARITEQDAMAILLEWDAYRAERSASGVTPAHFKKWLNLAGRALLNKLNADREQVPAVAVYDLSPANAEGEIRDRLIAMGWTPPGYTAVAVPDLAVLVGALERIENMDSMSYHSLESARIVARKALAAHRKGEQP